MAAGSIVVDLLMRTGAFQSDTKRAEKALKDLESSATKIGAAIGVAVVGAAVSTVALFDQLAKAAGEYQDLADMTGASAEALASYAVAAATAGVSMESVTGAMLKLTKGLTGVDDESKAAGAALGALGLNVDDFKKLDPAAQYEAIGKALSGFEDGASKAAVAQALFGKAGAEQLKVFKALEDQGGRTTILTQKQIELADAYADKQSKLTAELRLYAQAAATEALPALNDLTKAFSDVFLDIIGVDKATGHLKANNGVKEFAEGAADALAFVADAVQGVVTIFYRVGEFIGATGAAMVAKVKGDTAALKAIQDDYNASLDNGFKSVRARLAETRAQAAKDAAAAASFVGPPAPEGPRKPKLKFDGANKPEKGGAKDDPTKKLLDNQLKELERGIKREQDLMGDRNEFLELYNGQGLLSIQSYYDAQRTIMEAATSSQVAAYDKEIEALRAYQKKAGKQTDKTAAEGKIQDLIDKRSQLEQEAGKKSLILNIKQTEAEARLKQEIEGVSAQVIELQGNLGAAAAIRFDAQNLDLVRRLTAAGNTGALAMIKSLREMTIAQAKFSQASTISGQITESLRNDEERISIARELGATTELGALKQLGEARSAAVKQMEAVVTAQEAIAKASGNPALVLNAERARIELEKLRATADPLADKFRSIFQDSFAGAFAGLIDGTKTAKQALKSFVSDVTSQLTRIASQNVAETLFGKEGPLGGVGELFGGAFGGVLGGGKSAAKPSVDTSAITRSLALLQASGVEPATSALARLQQAADAAAGALGGKDKGDGKGAGTGDGAGAGQGEGQAGATTPVDTPWESDFPSSTSGGGSDAPWESGFEGTSGVSAATEATASSIADFGITATDASSAILKMADAAGEGGGAISKLPQLLQAVFSSFSGSSGGGGGGGGGDGIWATLASAAVSYFGGAKASGGDVLRGRSYLVGEMGPERFVPRTAGTIIPAQQPTGAAAQRPIQVIQNFPAGTSRATADQAAAQAGAAVRRANARTR